MIPGRAPFDFAADRALALLAMNYAFRYAGAEPTLEYGASRQWDGLAARRLRATPGRHVGAPMDDHRILFYLSREVMADCGCEGLRQSRVQTVSDFDLVPAGATGFWEDHDFADLLSVRIAPELVASVAEGLELPAERAQLAPRLAARDPMVTHVALTLAAEVDAPAPASRLYADSLATALATRLVQDFALGGGALGRQTLSKPQIRRVVTFVEENLEADLGLAQIAEAAGLSIPHLTALFRRTMGQSVHSYVMERRVERARALLLGRRLSVAEVAAEAGFAHQSHMARWMRRLLGVTPSEILRG